MGRRAILETYLAPAAIGSQGDRRWCSIPQLGGCMPTLQRQSADRHSAQLRLAELERRRTEVQACIDAASLETTTPAQFNLWLAERVLIDRSIGRQIQALVTPERT